MKKYLSVLTASLLAVCLILSGCGKDHSKYGEADPVEDDTSEVLVEEEFDDGEEEETPQEAITYSSLEEALPVLERDGYKKTSEGYVAEDQDSEVSSKRVVTAKGNNVNVELNYNYSTNDENKNMTKFYKNEHDAVSIMVSSFITRLANETDVEEGNLTYTIKVADKEVASGEMTLEEAYEYSAMADD